MALNLCDAKFSDVREAVELMVSLRGPRLCDAEGEELATCLVDSGSIESRPHKQLKVDDATACKLNPYQMKQYRHSQEKEATRDSIEGPSNFRIPDKFRIAGLMIARLQD